MSHNQAEWSCEKLWAPLEMKSPVFIIKSARGVFFFVGLLTSLKWDGSFIERDNQTRLKQNMSTMFFVGGGGNLSSVDLPLFFSGGVMFYRLPWKVEKPCYKQMHVRNEWALEKVNQTGTATLLFYMKFWCICKKNHLCDWQILAKWCKGFRSASGGTPKCSWLVESMRPCQLLCWKNQLSQAVVVKETR